MTEDSTVTLAWLDKRIATVRQALDRLPGGTRPSWVSCDEAILLKELRDLEAQRTWLKEGKA